MPCTSPRPRDAHAGVRAAPDRSERAGRHAAEPQLRLLKQIPDANLLRWDDDSESGKIPNFHPILTTDIFEFGTTTNDLWKQGMAVEMDDACLGLACSELRRRHAGRACGTSRTRRSMGPCRCAPRSCADYYYSKFGYWTTVMSALVTWGIIAGL